MVPYLEFFSHNVGYSKTLKVNGLGKHVGSLGSAYGLRVEGVEGKDAEHGTKRTATAKSRQLGSGLED